MYKRSLSSILTHAYKQAVSLLFRQGKTAPAASCTHPLPRRSNLLSKKNAQQQVSQRHNPTASNAMPFLPLCSSTLTPHQALCLVTPYVTVMISVELKVRKEGERVAGLWVRDSLPFNCYVGSSLILHHWRLALHK